MGDTTEQKALVERVSSYYVCAVPDDYPEASIWSVRVEWTGRDRWAVRWRSQCVGKRGNLSYESIPSSRTDAWLRAYRHDLPTALKIARKIAPRLVVNGLNAQGYIDWYTRYERPAHD